MADTLPFPTEDNVETYRDFVNIQKIHNDMLQEERKLKEESWKFTLDVQQRIAKHHRNEQIMIDAIRKKMAQHERMTIRGIKATSEAQRKYVEGLVNAAKQKIDSLKMALSLSREENALEIDMAKRQFDHSRRYFNFAAEQAKEMFGIQVKEYEYVSKTAKTLMSLGKGKAAAGIIAATLMMIKGAYELFNKMDTAAWNLRKAMGMTRNESATIRKDAQQIAIDYMDMGVSIDGVYKSYQAIGKIVGGIHNVTKALVEDISLMSAQLNISEDTSVMFLRNMAAVSKSSMESQISTMYVAKNMSNAAGVQLDDVMKDVASRSSKTLLMMSRLPSVAIRTAVELRRMGTSMEAVASAGSHVLDFNQSVNDEMDASVLLGTSINMQRIRELTYARDLEGVAKETVRLAQKHGFATKMDYFQMKAFAQMTGFSEDQLLSMVQTSTQMEKIRRSGTPEQKLQLKLYEKMRKENEAAAKARAKDSSAILRTLNNQTRLAAISAKWNQILARAQSWLLPIIDNMLALVIPAMDIARGIFGWVVAFKLATKYAGALAAKVASIVAWFAVFPRHVASFIDRFARFPRIFNALRSLSERLTQIWVAISKLNPFAFLHRAIRTFLIARSLGLEMTGIFQRILYYVGKITWFLAGWADRIRFAFSEVGMIGKAFASIGRFLAPVGRFFTTIGKWIGSLAKLAVGAARFGLIVGKIALYVGKFAGLIDGIGEVIMAFQFVYYLIVRLKGIGDAFNKGFFHGLWFGLKAIVGALYDVLLGPFVDAFKWIWSFFGGKSPSYLGMGIVNGIKSIGGMLFNAIIMPWKHAFAVIKFLFKSLIPFGLIIMGFKFLKKLFPETFGALSNLFGKIWGVLKKTVSSIWEGYKFLFKWFNPIGLAIQGFKLMWSVGKKIVSVLWEGYKFLFKWFNPISRAIQAFKLIWTTIRAVFSKARDIVDGFFSGLKNKFKSIVKGWIGNFDRFLSFIVNGITSIGSSIIRGIVVPIGLVIQGFKMIWGIGKKIVSVLREGVNFLVKWSNPINIIILGFKFLKKLFPETFAAIGNLFGKIWGVQKKIISFALECLKFYFKWLNPIGLVFQVLKLIWWVGTKIISLVWEGVKAWFKWMFPIGLAIKGIKMIWGFMEKTVSSIWEGAKFWLKWLNPIGLAIQGFKLIWWVGKKIVSVLWEGVKAWFKWMFPIGLVIQGFKFLKKLFPETFAAIGNLFGKIWGVQKKIISFALECLKFYFKWLNPIGLVFQVLKLIWWVGTKIISLVWEGVKAWFKWMFPIGLVIKGIKTIYGLMKKTISSIWEGAKFLFKFTPIGLAIRGIKLIGTTIRGVFSSAGNIVRGFFSGASGWFTGIGNRFKSVVKGWIKGFDHFLASIVNGIKNIGSKIIDGITAPFKKAFGLLEKIPLIGRMFGSKTPKVEKVPVLTPEKTKQDTSTPDVKAALDKMKKEADITSTARYNALAKDYQERGLQSTGVKTKPIVSEQLPENKILQKTQESPDPTIESNNRIIALLEKIAGKDTTINMDGNRVSTYMARGIEFHGGWGSNKV